MKFRHVAVSALLLALAACRAVPSFPRQYTATNITTLVKVFSTSSSITSEVENSQLAPRADSPPPAKRPKLNPDSPEPAVDPEPQSEWDKHVCRGEKLTQASKLDKDKAEAIALPIDTKWTGDLEAERRLWGYTDSEEADCDFEGDYYDITRALGELNVDVGSECFRTQHFDPDGGPIEEQIYYVGGKTYHVTGSHAILGINVQEGVVFLIDVLSPPRSAARMWHIDEPPRDQLPDLMQISDIVWGFWYQSHGGSDLGHITKFIVTYVINDITRRLIDEALRTYDVPDGEERLDAVPEWPGITFEIDTAPGKALLGSPVGIATAYFLSQHKQEIGNNKYISRVTVFRPDDHVGQEDPTIVYHVEDAPLLSPESSHSDSDPGDDHSCREVVLNEDEFVSATDVKELWHDSVCRGERLTQASKANKNDAAQIVTPIETPWKGSMEAELETWGYRELPSMSHCNFEDIEDGLEALSISTKSKDDGGLNYCYQVRHSYGDDVMDPDGNQRFKTYTVDGKTYQKTGAHAIIGANTVSGVVFFVDVRSAFHAAKELWYPEVPTAETLPKLRAMSDISWAFWTRTWMQLSEESRNLGNINYFVVHDIVNKETEQLLEEALEVYEPPDGQMRVADIPEWPGLTFDIESEPGKALLGSPNGIAAGYFLAQHKTEIGANKYVYQIQVFTPEWGGGPSMILHVKDAPAAIPNDPGTGVDRRWRNPFKGRGLIPVVNSSTLEASLIPESAVTTTSGNDLDDHTLWNTCKCRGEKITQASLQNKDTVMALITPVDSPWEGTMEAELKLWGYTELSGLGLYCNFDNVLGPMKEMGIDTKFKERFKDGQNKCYQARHGKGGMFGSIQDQTYVVGGKTYRMTDAVMQLGVNARDGMITFFNVRSAEQSAMQRWGVDKVDPDDLPKLNRVSDVSWAFWKRAHKDDVGLNNIQKFHVHDVANEGTLRLIAMVLKTYEVPEGDKRRTRLPKWPGLVFSIETDEGKVMLGSPNGIAAGYFLAQHKTQLGGNKYIYQVTIWNDSDGDAQMVFWVEDAPPVENKQEGQIDRIRPDPDEDHITKVSGKAGVVVKRSQDGRNVVREHRILAKL